MAIGLGKSSAESLGVDPQRIEDQHQAHRRDFGMLRNGPDDAGYEQEVRVWDRFKIDHAAGGEKNAPAMFVQLNNINTIIVQRYKIEDYFIYITVC
jgi:hypothetical protein